MFHILLGPASFSADSSTTAPASAPHVPTTVAVPPITARPYRACDALRWCGPFHLSTRESSHDLLMACLTVVPRTDLCSIVSPLAQLLALSGQSDCRHSVAFPKRRRRTCIRATLAALGGLWPCLCMFAPGVEQKRVSHSFRLHVGPGGTDLPARAYLAPDTCQTRTYLWTWRPHFWFTWYSALGTRRSEPRAGQLPRRLRAPATSALDRERSGALAVQRPRYSSASVCFKAELTVTRQKSAIPSTRTERLQRHLLDDICSSRNAHVLSMNLTQI